MTSSQPRGLKVLREEPSLESRGSASLSAAAFVRLGSALERRPPDVRGRIRICDLLLRR